MKQVKDIMTRDLTAVSESNSLKEVVAILAHYRFSGVPVVDDEQRLTGFISEKDLISSAVPGQFRASDDFFPRDFASLASQMSQAGESQVRDFMTREAVYITEDEDISYLAELMLSKGLKTVPVVREKKLVGVVGRAELCRALMTEGE